MDEEKENTVSQENETMQDTVEFTDSDKTDDDGKLDVKADHDQEPDQLNSNALDEETGLEEVSQNESTVEDKPKEKIQPEEGKPSEEERASPDFGVVPNEEYDETKSEDKVEEEGITQADVEDLEQDNKTEKEEIESVEGSKNGDKPDEENRIEEAEESGKIENGSPDLNPQLSDKKEGNRKKLRQLMFGITAAILLVALSIGLFTTMWKPVERPMKTQESTPKGQVIRSEVTPQRKAYRLERQSPIDQKLSKIDDLISALKSKRTTIAHIKQQYKAGIDEVEDEISKEIVSGRLETYQDAMKEKPIELDLLTIQRRQVYIQELDRLVEQLVLDSEELRYLKRRIEIDKQMADIIQGMDMNALVKRADTIIQQHLHDDDKLTIAIKDVRPRGLKAIWEEIFARRKKLKERIADFSKEETADREIWREICGGNFERKHELTKISPEAAKCLSEWKGKDLFLSRLTHLSPEEAKYLSRWKGRWLSLNGLSELSTEAAKYLSRWQGSRLSLNGLKELSPEVMVYLYKWKGDELELVSLDHPNRWEKSGKRVHLANKYIDN